MRSAAVTEEISLRLRSDPRYLALIRSLVRGVGALAGFDDSGSNALALAVDESCTNIIRHAYGGRTDGKIELSFLIQPDANGARVLVIRLRDYGTPAPAQCSAALAPKDPLKPGGLGLHLIRCIMDSVEFDHTPARGNLLQMSIACPTPKAHEPAAPGGSPGKPG